MTESTSKTHTKSDKAAKPSPLYAPLGWILKGVALLPFGILYALGDLLWFIAYRVVGYRRKVVARNLSESFPDRTPEELRKIEHEFYHNLADEFVETVKLGHVTDREMKTRMEFEGVEIIDRLISEGRSVCVYFSHCFNWEWAPAVTLWSRYGDSADVEFSQVYRPLRNVWFDRWYLRLRSRFGSVSYPKKTVLRDLLMIKRSGKQSVTGFMSDQKPSHGDPTYVTTFLNHPTAMITGTETLARKLGMGAVYWDMHKLSRGHYRIVVRLMSDDASQTAPMELTAMYTRMLQESIEREPSLWLWTHKRWKIPVTLPSASDNITPTPLPAHKHTPELLS